MHYFDIAIIVIILASTVEGGIRGFAYEVFSLAGLIIGLYLALRFFALAAGYLLFLGLPDWLLNVVSFMLILVVISTLFRFIGKALKATLEKIFMGWLDHLLGVLFGAARGVILVLLITMLMLLTPLRQVIIQEAPRTRLLRHSYEIVAPIFNRLTQEQVHSPLSV